jgi:uncharacterized GH25 family protein
MIKKLLLLFVLTISTVLTAHEFWIEPQKFNLKRGETLKLNLKVGENFQGITGMEQELRSIASDCFTME